MKKVLTVAVSVVAVLIGGTLLSELLFPDLRGGLWHDRKVATEMPFTISDIRVDEVLKIGNGGNPDDDEFEVTWKVTDHKSTGAYYHPALAFSMVDEREATVVDHFYGAGVHASHEDEARILGMPPSCATGPAYDNCFSAEELLPGRKYRLRAFSTVCLFKDIGLECPNALRGEPVYSNWFSLTP